MSRPAGLPDVAPCRHLRSGERRSRIRDPRRLLPLAACLWLALAPPLRGEGNETLGPVRPDLPLAAGNRVLAAGVGLEYTPAGVIELEVPADFTVLQVLLYWGTRSSRGDPEVLVNGSTRVRGELIGTSPGFPGPQSRPFVHRADVTGLHLLSAGVNHVTVSGLDILTGTRTGAELVVIGDDGRGGAGRGLVFRDGCDFAYWRFSAPFRETVRQRLTFAAAAFARTAELTLVVGDHLGALLREQRPSTLEVQAEGGVLQTFLNPLVAADGDAWDTLVLPVVIPPGATFVEAQLFSDSRAGSKLSPSSFYWLVAALNLPAPAAPPRVFDISGTVYCDNDASGDRDPGEPGIAGAEVRLSSVLGGNGTLIVVLTDRDGRYRFREVPEGSRVAIEVLPGPAIADKEPTEVCMLPERLTAEVRDCDFGFAFQPLVGDTVFNDLNGDGAQQPGEPGLAGVFVGITVPAGGGFPGFSDNAFTGGDGKYLFRIPGLSLGMAVVATVGIDPTTGGALGKELTTPNPQTTGFLGLGGSDLARDFGLQDVSGPGDVKVGGTVFLDVDGDGRRDPGEEGLSGVLVGIACPPSAGFPGFGDTRLTGEDGSYLFTISDVPATSRITCSVSIDPNTGEAAGKVLTTGNPQTAGPLGPGEMDLGRDFGLEPASPVPPALAGGTVFCDLDGDRRFDPGEPGIAGVPLEFRCPAVAGFPGAVLAATSGSQGQYLFRLEGLPPGVSVACTITVATDSPATARKILTSANPQSTGLLVAGSDVRGLDFGFKPLGARVGDTVFLDTDGDGFQDAGERGLQGVLVTLQVPPAGAFGGLTDTRTTDGAGKYLFVVEGLSESAPVTGSVVIDPLTGEAAGLQLTTPNPQATIPLLPGVDDLGRDFGLEPVETPEAKFLCGGPVIGPGNVPVQPQGFPGETVEVCFYYCSPEEELQGVSIAVRYDCRLECLESSFHVPPDSITAAVGADFVSFQCENDPADGDGCELLLGILVDSRAPFTGATLPATSVPLKLACVDMRIRADAPCGTCLPIEFHDGVNGRNKVPVKNLFSIDNNSFSPATVDCCVLVAEEHVFIRGDCNFDDINNIADSVATFSFLFGTGGRQFRPPCLDACDSNDDAKVDLSDGIDTLNWQFRGGRPPPPPGPYQAGLDPTPDSLPCQAQGCP